MYLHETYFFLLIWVDRVQKKSKTWNALTGNTFLYTHIAVHVFNANWITYTSNFHQNKFAFYKEINWKLLLVAFTI